MTRALRLFANVVAVVLFAALALPWPPAPARGGEVANLYEGTFTPTVAGGTSAGTATYVFQVGRYARVGNRVILQAAVSWNSGTGTGQQLVTGLPLALRNVSNDDTPCSILASSFTIGAGQLSAAIASNESQVRIWVVASGSALAANAYDAAAVLYLQCTYEVAP
ncbi:MAG TPA: hypothetical protein VN646_16845 [Candidatus Acidoferrum sp.]|nr:hypothetical protein [Candidatus Acidoferrum sp.]